MQSRPVRRRCKTRSQRTDEINRSNDAGITLKFWCNHPKKPAVYQKAQPVTRLISQHSLPFFDHNCKQDSDDANKSIMLNSIMAELVLISQVTANWIDAGQLSLYAPMIIAIDTTQLAGLILRLNDFVSSNAPPIIKRLCKEPKECR